VAGNKKSNPPPPKIYICYICGKEIHGDCEHITTRRRTELHIHFECVPGKVNNKV
jgi:hypothetical protein